jgi:asparagine synthase (glutamine-hydrolysing)
MKTTIAVLNKSGENVTPLAIRALGEIHGKKGDCFGIVTSTERHTAKDSKSLADHCLNYPLIVAYAISNALPQSKPKIIKMEKATLFFDGTIYPTNSKSSKGELIQQNSQTDPEMTAKSILKKCDGDFFLLIAKDQEIWAARDPIGVKPLYYGENKTIAAFASNRRALWELEIEKTYSFPPGHLGIAKAEGFKFEPIKRLAYTKPKPTTMDEGVETLRKLIESAVIERVRGLNEVAVGFSGGLDSSLIAHLAKKHCKNVHLVHVSMKNQFETKEAQKAAAILDLPMQAYFFGEEDVEKTIPKVVELIEEADPVKLGVGIPFYWTAQKAAENGFKVLLAGQGADELFGGYKRYVSQYIQEGGERAADTMFRDIVGVHKSNLERDAKICNFHNIELRLPFASYRIAKFAVSLPLELKIERKEDSLRKLVLRRVAEKMGIPGNITQKPKKAVQYSTGVGNALKRIAKNHKITLSDYVQKIFGNQSKAE